MNQILDHSGPKQPKTPTNSNDIKKIIKIFAIIIAVFGVILIGFGIFTVIKNSNSKKAQTTSQTVEQPTITANKNDDDTVTVKVVHQKTIETVEYAWDSNAFVVSKGMNEQKEMTIKDIGIPAGTHQLHVKVVDIDNQEFSNNYEFTSESGVDTMDPIVDIVLQGNVAEIVATDETELSFMTYSINSGDEITVRPEGEDKKKISKIITLPEGKETKISVKAVDTSNNETPFEKITEIYQKPKIELRRLDSDNQAVDITVTSAIEITKITVDINDKQQEVPLNERSRVTTEDGTIKYHFIVRATNPGRNIITVNAYTEREDVVGTQSGYITNN